MCVDPRPTGPLPAARPLLGWFFSSLVGVSVLSCGGPSAATRAAENAAGSPVEVRAGHDFPSLSLVARDGDSFAAIAVAVAHDGGSVVSAWLGALIEERARRALLHPIEVRPSGNGLVVRMRVDTPEQATRAMRLARDVLSRPITAAEIPRAAERVRATPVRTFVTASERAVGECVGELGSPAPASAPSLADLEKWRAALFSSQTVALSAVGPRGVLDAVADGLQGGESWPSGSPPQDPWPAADIASAYAVQGSARTLSIALRVAEPARAVEAAKALGARQSPLSAHVAALDPAWSVERVVGTTRTRGACLRIDMNASIAPPLHAAADVAALALDEAGRALAEAPGATFSLDRAVLESWDPRDAAAVAAWRALSAAQEAGPRRAFVSYGHPATDPEPDAGFPALLAQAANDRRSPSLDVRRRSETGQGELWVLLASPCSTGSETTSTAGISALAVRTLAAKAADESGVRVEPWVSSQGIGLLAHAPRTSASEGAMHHATRVAAALGRAIAGSQIADEDAALARTAIQADLDPEMEPLWPVALEALVPKHPSLLDPRGTWQSVTDLSTQAADVERRAIVRGPLRVLVLGGEAARPADVARELERWLRPERSRATRCPPLPPVAAHPGEYEVDAAPGAAGARAVVAVTLPLFPMGGVPVEADYTAFLLNRPGGWLDRAVRAPGLAVHAEATVLGGGDAGALAIEVSTPGPSARPAAAQVRALLSRLSDGIATADELALARTAFDDARAAARVDPRRRIVDAWLGRPTAKPPDLAALRAFHRQAFSAERHVVVLTRTK